MAARLTTKLRNALFPSLAKARWAADVHWNDLAKAYYEQTSLLGLITHPIFIQPDLCENWMNKWRKGWGVKYSWGGYMEDRKDLWKGYYHKPGKTTHLGTDFDVPEGTPVHLPVAATLVYHEHDADQEGGWGTRLIFQNHVCCFTLAHLDAPYLSVGTRYDAGISIGTVAPSTRNGNWYPHLHIQTSRILNPEHDGYGSPYNGIDHDYPNPIILMCATHRQLKGLRKS